MTPCPVRTPRGPNHLCRPTGRGYATACGRVLAGPDLIVPPRRLWRRVWRHELLCRTCAQRAEQAASVAQLARLAGWR